MVVLGLMSTAIYRIMPSLNRILVNWVQIRTYSYSVSELQDSFKKKQFIVAKEPGLIQFGHTIQLKNVSFQYPESTRALFQNLNLTIRKGDFLVIEGPSGAGKTTLIHLLAGLLTDYQGQIRVDETVLAPATIRSWQRKLSFVPQAPVVLEDTVLQNVAFGEESIDPVRVKKALELSLLDDFTSAAPQKLNTHVGENGLTLSGGQRQRLVMARAFYREPEVFLLDEVTNQLDEKNKFLLLGNLKKLASSNKVVILISHDPAVKSFATSIIHLEGGLISQIYV
jgi:ABC-type bacteriocin/lantibiotic exporter with double-glycine peptidase domain